MQKVSKLAQLAQMDKIHQQAKLGQMILVIKQAKKVKHKKYWTRPVKKKKAENSVV